MTSVKITPKLIDNFIANWDAQYETLTEETNSFGEPTILNLTLTNDFRIELMEVFGIDFSEDKLFLNDYQEYRAILESKKESVAAYSNKIRKVYDVVKHFDAINKVFGILSSSHNQQSPEISEANNVIMAEFKNALSKQLDPIYDDICTFELDNEIVEFTNFQKHWLNVRSNLLDKAAITEMEWEVMELADAQELFLKVLPDIQSDINSAISDIIMKKLPKTINLAKYKVTNNLADDLNIQLEMIEEK